MKIRISAMLAIFFVCQTIFAQTPQSFKYQTVVRDAAGELIQNQNVSFRFNVHDVNPAGVVVYSETHTVMTNEFGLATTEIGSGTPVSGTFSAIDWGVSQKYLEVELDPSGGSAFTSMGTAQLLSVPYSLYSENTANTDDADADPANELQTISKIGNTVTLSDGGGSFTDQTDDADADPANELNNSINLDGTSLELTDAGGTIITDLSSLIDDADADPANELQNLSIVGNDLSISDGNTVTLPGSGEISKIADSDGDTWIDTEVNSDNDSIIFYTFGMERMIISHNGYVDINGQLSATGFTGDGSGLTGIPGDDLGNHTATEALNMDDNQINNLQSPTDDHDAATKIYVDTTCGDNLGNHIALQTIELDSNWISNDGDQEGIYIDTAGNVGINTHAPPFSLSSSGKIHSDDHIMAAFGSNSEASYRFGYGGENSGLSSPYYNSVSVITDGNERMTVRENGNVGIGTSNPQEMLHVGGTVRIADGTQAAGRVLTSDADGTASWTDPGSGSGDNDWEITGDDMYSEVSGNVGIGTSSPNAKLEVAGRISQTAIGQSVFIGLGAGENDDLTMNRNVFVGQGAGNSNTDGDRNTSVGYHALNTNIGGMQNAAFGFNALHLNEAGSRNTATGFAALNFNTIANENTANGYMSLYSNTEGYSNTAVGSKTLYSNILGYHNVASGRNALYSNVFGHSNVAIGVGALYSNYEKSNLVAIGDSALYHNGIGASTPAEASCNTAIGDKALMSNSTGSNNTATGYKSLANNTTGFLNIAFGSDALFSNTTGSGNTAIGAASMTDNTTGAYNTATGMNALASNTIGNHNTAMGYVALVGNTTGESNTACGNASMRFNQTGNRNTAIGSSSLLYNTSGHRNTAIGCVTLTDNTTGDYNTALGYESLHSNTTAGHNIAIGYRALLTQSYDNYGYDWDSWNIAIGDEALYSNQPTSDWNGDRNMAVGHASLWSNTTGSNNTAVGYESMHANTTGFNNVALGSEALSSNTTGENNTAIGCYALNTGSFINATALGYDAEPGASNTIAIGNTSVTWIGGQVSWSTYSDAKAKTEVTEDVKGLDFILNLRPVTYRFDKDKMDQLIGTVDSSDYSEKYEIENIKQSGFLAQEVEKAAKKSGYDFSGVSHPKGDKEYYSLAYAEFVVPLVKAVQEQQATIEELKAEIEKLKKDK